MSAIDWFQELSFFVLMLVAAFIGGYIGLRLKKPSPSSEGLRQDRDELSAFLYAFLIFSGMFVGATIVEDIHILSSYRHISPVKNIWRVLQ